jgi:pimeloyl-ACP methyl ester carboxylesterase
MQHFATSDGEHIHYRATGRGPVLLFLHGWTSSHREWWPFAEALADSFRCVCWDARGHGGHPPRNTTPNRVERMALDLHELFEHLALERATVLGHSMGAMTTWEYLRRFGCARLERLVFVDQSPKLMTDSAWEHGIYSDFNDRANAAFIERMERDFSEAVLGLIGESRNPQARAAYRAGGAEIERTRGYLQQLRPEPLIEIWKSLMNTDFRDVLPDISVPTLLVHGDASHFYSLAVAEYVRGQIPQAELVVYAGSDHSPHLWQRQRFIDDIRDFCASREAQRDAAMSPKVSSKEGSSQA